MIDKDQVLQLLLDACPSFKPTWEEDKDEYWDENTWLLYPIVGRLANHVIEAFLDDRKEEVRAYCDLAERLHLEGDTYVRELAKVGLLEDLQTWALHHAVKLDTFLEYLGPASARSWTELIAFWTELEEKKRTGDGDSSNQDLSGTTPAFRKRFGNLLRPSEGG